MARLRLFPRLVLAGVAAVASVGMIGVVLTASPAPVAASSAAAALPSSASHPQFGVLLADPTYMTSDYAAGVRLAMVEVEWNQWEPSPGVFNHAYQSQEVARVNSYLRAGFTVGINPRLNTAPTWVYSSPGTHLVDQNGNSSSTPDYEYSAVVRSVTGAYLANLVATLPAVSYYTIGYGTNGELEYPATTGGQWWAFDPEAQGTTAGVVGSVGVSPMPGWVPGTAMWHGRPVSATQVSNWYDWYLGADINLAKWEMATIRSGGFGGNFQIKFPGTGANPWVYNYRLSTDLASTPHDPYNSLNVGQVYQVVIPALAAPGVVVNITSVGDESGSPADNACQASDRSVNWQTNSAVDTWSSVRWQSYLAARSGLPVIGESVGNDPASDVTHDINLMKGCGLIGLEWAWDFQLHGGGYATIGNLANGIAATATSPVSAGSVGSGGSVVALSPVRLVDTRSGVGVRGPVGADSTVRVGVVGAGGVPSLGVSAVLLNVTVTGALAAGNVVVHGDGTAVPVSSNVNFGPGQTVANLVVVAVGADGKVALTTESSGSVQLVVDVDGYVTAGTATSPVSSGSTGSVGSGGSVVALSPVRLVDTRSGVGVRGPVGADSTVRVGVVGAGGVPSLGVSAVLLNVTVTGALAAGNVVVHGDGTAVPVSSNVNFGPGQTVANLVVVAVGADGKVALTTESSGSVQLVVDVDGYVTAGTATSPVSSGSTGSVGSGGSVVALSPVRLVDTRSGVGVRGPVGADSTVRVGVVGAGGVPSLGVSAVLLNVTVTGALAAGNVVVHGDGTAVPVSSNVNFGPGQTVANLVVVAVGADGKVALTTESSGSVQLVVDVDGYVTAGTGG